MNNSMKHSEVTNPAFNHHTKARIEKNKMPAKKEDKVLVEDVSQAEKNRPELEKQFEKVEKENKKVRKKIRSDKKKHKKDAEKAEEAEAKKEA